MRWRDIEAKNASRPRIRCLPKPFATSRIIRSAIAARSAAASRMPIRPRRCRAWRSPARRRLSWRARRHAKSRRATSSRRADDGARADRVDRGRALAALAGNAALGVRGVRAPHGDFALAGVALFYDLDADGPCADAHIAAIGVRTGRCASRRAEEALGGKRIGEQSLAARLARPGLESMQRRHSCAGGLPRALLDLFERALTRAARLGEAA